MAEGPARQRSAAPLARWAYWIVLSSAFAVLLWRNLPGHLTLDSVLALREGRFGLRETWNPAIFGWLLGLSDRVRPGAGALVVASSGLIFASLGALAALRGRTSWWGVWAAGLVVFLPQLVLWPAIVWKDVLFTSAAIASMVMLAGSLRAGPDRPVIVGLVLAAVLMAVAGLLRQNGLIVAAPAALAIAWIRWPRGARTAVGAAVAWLALVLALAFTFDTLARPQGAGQPDEAGAKGLRILQMYDLVGAANLLPGRATPQIDRVSREAGDYIRSSAGRLYSTERVDVMNNDPQYDLVSHRITRAAVQAEWLDLVRSDPALYLRVRAGVFRQVFATPVVDRCLPVHVGVVGPPSALASLGMAARHDKRDQRIYNYVTWHLDTPSMSHITYAVLAGAVLCLLMRRREPTDVVMAAMLTGALAFAASFFVISIACDYRYLYFLDMAAITGVLYWALDPRLSRSFVPEGVVELR